MLENSYLIGLATSIKISIGIGIIFFIVFIVFYSKIFIPDWKNIINDFDALFLLFIYSLGVSTSCFLLIYPLYNLISQIIFNLEFYQKEISQGTLALRITSLLLGFNFLKSLYIYITSKLKENQDKLVADYPDLQKIEPLINVQAISFLLLTQNLIYGAVILLLWIFIFLSKTLFELRVVSWGLFFIIDDWAIISDNLIALKGRILKWHRLRIVFFNGLLSILMISACFRQLNNLLFSLLITVILFVLVYLNTFYFFSTNNKK